MDSAEQETSIGVSGAPILIEILSVLVFIFFTSLWVVKNSSSGTLPAPIENIAKFFLSLLNSNLTEEHQSVALPALVMTREQRRCISKMSLPSRCVFEMDDIPPTAISKDTLKPAIGKEASGDDSKGAERTELNHSVSLPPLEKPGVSVVALSGTDPKGNVIKRRLTTSVNMIKTNLGSIGLRKLLFLQAPNKKKKGSKVFKFVKNDHSLSVLRNKTPLLVFVNPKSGGQRGQMLFYQLRNLLEKYQVYDLMRDKGPEKGIMFFKDVPNYRILVCGGDGTIGWVLGELDRLESEGKISYRPPVGILALGTGNDLAQVLGWGSGSMTKPVVDHLCDIAKAKSTPLDRWRTVIYNAPKKTNSLLSRGTDGIDEMEELVGDDKIVKVMNSYLGLGVDAQIALNFHLHRERKPHLFKNRLLNKIWYTASGGTEIFKQRFLDFSRKVRLFCDGREVSVPIGIEGLIVLNISSYGGGVNLWGQTGNASDSIYEEGHSEDEGLMDIDDFAEAERNRRRSVNDLQNIIPRISKTVNGKTLSERRLSQIQTRANRIKGLLYGGNASVDDLMALNGGMESTSGDFSEKEWSSDDEFDDKDNLSDNAMTHIKERTVFEYKSFSPSVKHDGMVEVVGVQSSFQLGAAQVGLTKPTKLCQGKSIVILVKNMDLCPVQVDGEPFILESDCSGSKKEGDNSSKKRSCLNKVIQVGYLNSAHLLAMVHDLTESRTIDEYETVSSLLEWASREKVISAEQKRILLAESRKRSDFKRRRASTQSTAA